MTILDRLLDGMVRLSHHHSSHRLFSVSPIKAFRSTSLKRGVNEISSHYDSYYEVVINDEKKIQLNDETDDETVFFTPQKSFSSEDETSISSIMSEQYVENSREISVSEEAAFVERIAERVKLFPKFSSINGSKSSFHGRGILQITVSKYLERLIEGANTTFDRNDNIYADSAGVRAAILAIEYLERINVHVDEKSVHRYLAIAFLLALKFTEDLNLTNSFWAKVGSFTVQDTNKMESELLQKLEWKLTVSEQVYINQRNKYLLVE